VCAGLLLLFILDMVSTVAKCSTELKGDVCICVCVCVCVCVCLRERMYNG